MTDGHKPGADRRRYPPLGGVPLEKEPALSRRPIRLPLLLLLAALWAAPALAEPSEDPHFITQTIGDGLEARPTALAPIVGIHATAFPLARIGLFAESHGFSLTRRAALYDLAGGASLRLEEGIHLTASYRLVGVDLGFASHLLGADGEPGLAAPFLGLAFDF